MRPVLPFALMLAGLGLVGLGLVGDARAEPRAYAVDAKESLLYVLVAPDEGRIFSGLSHQHVIRATEMKGSVRFDPEAPAGCRIEITVPAASLAVDEPAHRKRLGIEGTLSESDRKTVWRHMLDEDQLFARKYPTIRFTGTGCTQGPSGWTVDGAFEVRGRKKAVKVPLEVDFEDGIRAKGEVTLRHEDFGFEPYSAGFGTIANDEKLRFRVELVAR